MTNINVSVKDSAGATASTVATFTVSGAATGLTWTCRKGNNCWSPIGWNTTGRLPYYAGPAPFPVKFPPQALTEFKAAGFDFIRLGVSPGPMCAATTEAELAGYIKTIVDCIQGYVTAGIGVCVNYAPGGGSFTGWESAGAIFDNVTTGPKFTRYLAVIGRVTKEIVARGLPPSKVSLSIFNEIELGDKAFCYPFMKSLWAGQRAEAPGYSIVVSPVGWASFMNLNGINAADFDSNTIYDIHAYMPVCAAYQGEGSMSKVYGIPYPPTNSAADFQTAMNNYIARGGSPNDSMNNPAAFEGLRCYFGQGSVTAWQNGPQDGAWLKNKFIPNAIEPWRKSNNVLPGQMMIGEWGIGGGPHPLTDAELPALLRDNRMAYESFGYIWDVHQYDYPSTKWPIGDSAGIFNLDTFKLRLSTIGPALFG